MDWKIFAGMLSICLNGTTEINKTFETNQLFLGKRQYFFGLLGRWLVLEC
jgi:hypothetical protein